MAMTKFHQELEYFIAHQDELVRQYRDKYLVLAGEQVFGAHPSVGEAYAAGVKEFGLGNFMLQLCKPGPEAYTSAIMTPGLGIRCA